MLCLHSNYEDYSETGVLAKYMFAMYFISDLLASNIRSKTREYHVHSDSVFSFGCMYIGCLLLCVVYDLAMTPVLFGTMLVAVATKHTLDTVQSVQLKVMTMLTLFGVMIFSTSVLFTVHIYFMIWLVFSFKAKSMHVSSEYMYNIALCSYITLQKKLWAMF